MMEVCGALLPLHRKLDRKLLRRNDSISTEPAVIGFTPIPNQRQSAEVWTHQPSGVSRIVPGAIGFAPAAAIADPQRAIIDVDLVVFLERPAAGLSSRRDRCESGTSSAVRKSPKTTHVPSGGL